MIYAVKCINYQDCQNQVRRYMKEYKLQLKRVMRYRATPVIVLNSGDEIHFVTHEEWKKRWNFGKTYQFIGETTTYHGIFPAKSQNVD